MTQLLKYFISLILSHDLPDQASELLDSLTLLPRARVALSLCLIVESDIMVSRTKVLGFLKCYWRTEQKNGVGLREGQFT